eukprot:329569-Chlamydomonas_euryale.AAC.8
MARALLCRCVTTTTTTLRRCTPALGPTSFGQASTGCGVAAVPSTPVCAAASSPPGSQHQHLLRAAAGAGRRRRRAAQSAAQRHPCPEPWHQMVAVVR